MHHQLAKPELEQGELEEGLAQSLVSILTCT